MKFIPRELSEKITYQGDSRKYDLELFALGTGLEEFYIQNPIWPDIYRRLVDRSLKSDSCIMWVYGKDWLFKRFHKDWTPEHGYEVIELTEDDMPKMIWRKNTAITDVGYIDDPYHDKTLEIPRWDITYKYVWYLDPKFAPTEDKIWVYECKSSWYEDGIKDMGYLSPDLTYEYNPEVPVITYDLPKIPLYDLDYEHIWNLDLKHGGWEGMWAVKVRPNWTDPKGTKYCGDISPNLKITFNPDLPNYDIEINYDIPYYDLRYEHIWFLDPKLTEGNRTWLLNISATDDPLGVKDMGDVQYNLMQSWTRNPDVSNTIQLVNDPLDGFQVPSWDSKFKHVWYLNTELTGGTKIWIYECITEHYDPEAGIKDMGELDHKISFATEKNPLYDDINFDVNHDVKYSDVDYEHMWFFDQKYTGDKKVWALRAWATEQPDGIKELGTVDIEYNQVWKRNPAVSDCFKFENDPSKDFVIPLWDRKYKHVWYLDTDLTNEDKIWAYECTTNYHDPEIGTKDLGAIRADIEFKIEYNSDIPDLKANIDYKIPYSDVEYEHIWFVDPKFTSGRKIWLARMYATEEPKGVKDMGYLNPDVAENLDVVFISYNELNAEENWQRVLAKAPNAIRVDGVKGIFEAHKKAAELAKSDMFYVVDGDAFLIDEWNFDFNPNIFDRDCVHVYRAQNPINNLLYGYGGVKLFPRKMLLEAKEWGVDMTTSIAPKLKVINKVSNITAFNTDPKSTWRSAFRECAKLAAQTISNQNIMETDRRLKVWLSLGKDQPYGEYALAGAAAGYDYGTKNKLNTELMKLINDRDWLDREFEHAKLP